ncbi:Rho termination factor N-terminal domain-containing protein [Staphylococcus americanisciuri]|uniref:Rho termination factor N-terminal domain-containing protein n=1 Tax=Staphylococcus americanisciuri TaxID=2973940 RepID=A0ABT2F106_9STAP|nr:Rho termination factor N-terminal domain-containing protein [Staphylococcus americanisciuri]MCS4486145.1 Rho termination factor N-terminal domain-containing protein [Staphylococcus americanisciuri]
MDKDYDFLEGLLEGLVDEESAQFEQALMERGIFPEQPDSIIELMSENTVNDIKELCKAHGIKGYSGMKKDEMLIHFIDELVTDTYIKEQIDKMSHDQRLAFVLAYHYREEILPLFSSITFPDCYLVFDVDEDDDGLPVLEIPVEVAERVGTYIEQKDTTLQALIRKYRVFEAATNLYGLYSYTQLQKVFKTYLDEDNTLMDIERFVKRCERVAPENVNCRIVNGAIVSLGLQLEEDEFVYFLKEADYYMPETVEDMLYFEKNVFSLADEDMIDFLSWLDQNVIKDNKFDVTPEQLNVELLTMMKHAISYDMITDLLLLLVNDGILRKDVTSTHQKNVKPIFMKMRNWVFHGHTFDEYMKKLDKVYKHDRSKIIDINDHRS